MNKLFPAQHLPDDFAVSSQPKRHHRLHNKVPLASSIGVVVALLIAIPVGLLTVSRDDTQHSPPAAGPHSQPPVWAFQCFRSDAGPVTHEYDGLPLTGAEQKAKQLGQNLLLVAKNGQCVDTVVPFVPHTVSVAVSNERVIFARGTYGG